MARLIEQFRKRGDVIGLPDLSTLTPEERTTARIVETKMLRQALDTVLQRVKALPDSEQRFHAQHYITNAVMWLGMSLKAEREALEITEGALLARIEERARVIYSEDPESADYPWLEGGNSTKQEDARRQARRELDPYPSSKDPATGANIEPVADGLKL